MTEAEPPCCDNNHETVEMVRVWSDPRGNSIFQCRSCGRKVQVRSDGRQI